MGFYDAKRIIASALAAAIVCGAAVGCGKTEDGGSEPTTSKTSQSKSEKSDKSAPKDEISVIREFFAAAKNMNIDEGREQVLRLMYPDELVDAIFKVGANKYYIDEYVDHMIETVLYCLSRFVYIEDFEDLKIFETFGYYPYDAFASFARTEVDDVEMEFSESFSLFNFLALNGISWNEYNHPDEENEKKISRYQFDGQVNDKFKVTDIKTVAIGTKDDSCLMCVIVYRTDGGEWKIWVDNMFKTGSKERLTESFEKMKTVYGCETAIDKEAMAAAKAIKRSINFSLTKLEEYGSKNFKNYIEPYDKIYLSSYDHLNTVNDTAREDIVEKVSFYDNGITTMSYFAVIRRCQCVEVVVKYFDENGECAIGIYPPDGLEKTSDFEETCYNVMKSYDK